jgi:hypothetical protein
LRLSLSEECQGPLLFHPLIRCLVSGVGNGLDFAKSHSQMLLHYQVPLQRMSDGPPNHNWALVPLAWRMTRDMSRTTAYEFGAISWPPLPGSPPWYLNLPLPKLWGGMGSWGSSVTREGPDRKRKRGTLPAPAGGHVGAAEAAQRRVLGPRGSAGRLEQWAWPCCAVATREAAGRRGWAAGSSRTGVLRLPG